MPKSQNLVSVIGVVVIAGLVAHAVLTYGSMPINNHVDHNEAWQTIGFIDFCTVQGPVFNNLTRYLNSKFPAGSDEAVLERALTKEGFLLSTPCVQDPAIHKAYWSRVWGRIRYHEEIEVYFKVDQSNRIEWIKALARNTLP